MRSGAVYYDLDRTAAAREVHIGTQRARRKPGARPIGTEQYDAALSDALRDITAVAAETRENSLGHADAVDSSPSDADTEISSVPESISAAATDPDTFSGSSDTAAADASGGYDTTDEYAEGHRVLRLYRRQRDICI